MVIMKIPILYLCWVVYWAIKSEPPPEQPAALVAAVRRFGSAAVAAQADPSAQHQVRTAAPPADTPGRVARRCTRELDALSAQPSGRDGGRLSRRRCDFRQPRRGGLPAAPADPLRDLALADRRRDRRAK